MALCRALRLQAAWRSVTPMAAAPTKVQGPTQTVARALTASATMRRQGLTPEDPYHSLLWNRERPIVEAQPLADMEDKQKRRAMLMRQYKDNISVLRKRFARDVENTLAADAAQRQDMRSEIAEQRLERKRAKAERRLAREQWSEMLYAAGNAERAERQKVRRAHFGESVKQGRAAKALVFQREKALAAEFLPMDLDELDAAIDDAIETEIELSPPLVGQPGQPNKARS
mmetsp:Transcript_28367/g.74496  ORF Transcript_28367/g.74496 Transcript_28367/m.74496 type:complete len:229 (-) Transcript_28367:161-847(-)